MKTLIVTLTVLAGLLLAGCSTPVARIRHDPTTFQRATSAQQELIKQGKVALGFDEGMVQLALGRPARVREKIDASGRSVIWSYLDYEPSYGWGGYGHGGWGGYGHDGWGSYGQGGWGGHHGFYSGYPYRPTHERARIVFKEDRVVAIEREQ